VVGASDVILWTILFASPQDDPARKKEIAAWIEELDHQDVADRDEAERKLFNLARDVRDAAIQLAKARSSTDAAVLPRLGRVRTALKSIVAYLPLPEEKLTGSSRGAFLVEHLQENLEIRQKLRTIRITIEKDAPLAAVVDDIREITGINIHISGIESADTARVQVKAKDVTVEALLRSFLGSHEWGHCVRDGVVLVAPRKAIRGQVKLELYEVGDLLESSGEDLIEKIRQNVRPKDWNETEGSSIQFQNGLLIVRHIPPVHRDLGAFLCRLRSGTWDNPAPAPRQTVVDLFASLHQGEKGGTDEAERQIAAMACSLTQAIEGLERVEGGTGDSELRLRAGKVLARMKESLGVEAIRDNLGYDELRFAVRSVRRLWWEDDDFDDFQDAARKVLGRFHAIEVRLVSRTPAGEGVLAQDVAKALEGPEGMVFLENGKAVVPPPGRALVARGEMMIFTLPDVEPILEGSARHWSSYVLVRLLR
jgi:hypothetical protein